MSRVNRSLWGLMSCFLMGCFLIGCQTEQRDSLHEMDHFVPAHWPSDLSDAVSKIDERLAKLTSDDANPSNDAETATARKELFDIVGWMPEIAADTYLEEAEWIPVYEASLELSKTLQKSGSTLDSEAVDQVRRFSDLLSERAKIEASHARKPIEERREPYDVTDDNEAEDTDGDVEITDASETQDATKAVEP